MQYFSSNHLFKAAAPIVESFFNFSVTLSLTHALVAMQFCSNLLVLGQVCLWGIFLICTTRKKRESKYNTKTGKKRKIGQQEK
jgi:hypothetical protein